jgi:transcriptional regulator with XRE-family HTH domain
MTDDGPVHRRRAPGADLGARIRAHREEAGVSLRELARRLDVSPSLLSQIERGLAQPSVSSLYAIVSELRLSLDALFAEPGRSLAGQPTMVLRAETRTVIELDGGVRWERLTPAPDPHATFALVTYLPGAEAPADDPRQSHVGRQYGYVVSGRIEIAYADEVLDLGPGDAIVFGADTPHRFRALGDEPAQAVWLNLSR